MAFIDTYRNAVKASGKPVVAYPLGSFGSYDSLMHYNVTPIADDGSFAATLVDVAFICMTHVVARGDFAAHPQWQEQAKGAKLRLTGATPASTPDDMAKLQRERLAAIPASWLPKLSVASQDDADATVAPVVAEPTSATLQPEDSNAKQAEHDAIVAATERNLTGNGARRGKALRR